MAVGSSGDVAADEKSHSLKHRQLKRGKQD